MHFNFKLSLAQTLLLLSAQRLSLASYIYSSLCTFASLFHALGICDLDPVKGMTVDLNPLKGRTVDLNPVK